MWILWIKVFHVLFVMGWVTGLFAVPRGLIYARREIEAQGAPGPAYEFTFRLWRFSRLLSALALVTGAILAWPLIANQPWLWAKLVLVLGLFAYHDTCGRFLRELKAGRLDKSETWLRVFNELSVLAVLAVLGLVLLRPF